MTVVELAVASARRRAVPVVAADTLARMLVGRQGLSPVMVGRAAALARLESLVRGESDRGDRSELPSVALVAGEAGVGKTRLLRELAAAAPEGTTVLAGQAEPGSLGRPLDVIHSLLGEVPSDPGDPRALATTALLSRLGSGRWLVMFEDLHWADSESVAVFELLAASPLPDLTLVATYRPDELTRQLPGGEMLVRLERRHHVHQVHLERLGRHEVAAFLAAVYGRPLSTAVIDALWGRTGGNPFFLEEILAAASDADPEQLAERPLPWSLAELVRRQLDGLSSDERRIIEAAAVLGSHAPFDVLALLTGCTEDELIAQLRILVGRGLLIEECEDEFSFRHALVCDAVEGQLLGRERRRLHEQALHFLRENSCTDLADLARHAAGAGRYDEMVELAREGLGHYLSVGSTHQALRLAVEALAEAPDDRDLLMGAARAAWLIGVHDEAWAHAHRLVELTPLDAHERRSAVVRLAARIAHERRDTTTMWELVDELRALVDVLPVSEERALAMAAIAQISMLHHRCDDAVDWADRAMAAADAVGAKGVRAQAMVEKATALTDVTGRVADGRAALVEAAEEAERVEDWVLVARALNNLSNVSRPAENREVLERMREAGRRAGFDNMVASNYLIRLGELATHEADAAAAERHWVRSSDYTMGTKERHWATGNRAALRLEQDRLDEAAELLATLDRPNFDDETDDWVLTYDVMLASRRGDREAARQAFSTLSARKHRPHAYSFEDFLRPLEAALDVGVSDVDIAEVARRWTLDAVMGDQYPLFLALVAGHHADHDAVLAHLDGRVDELALTLPNYLEASLRMHLGRALASHSRTTEARTQADRARALLDRWPGWRREQADALVARLSTVGAATEGELTRREREVAALLAEGLTNAELARRLYISPKTAAVHVSNILMKLGMSSRAEVAAWAVRNGLSAA